MDTLLVVIQLVLGLLFTLGGVLKLTIPYDKYSSISAVAWSKDFKPVHIRLIGILEVSGGFGLLLPLFVPALTMLTPLAAVGVALYISGAMATHLRRSEYLYMAANLLFCLGPALLVAYGNLVGFAAVSSLLFHLG